MRRALLAAFILASVGPALGQEANPDETTAINEIAQCLVEGLPDNWAAAHMVVELSRPGGVSGGVRYLVVRKDAEDNFEPFTPCDTDRPAKILIGLREAQPPERRGWTSARLVVERDGTFRVNYGFPT